MPLLAAMAAGRLCDLENTLETEIDWGYRDMILDELFRPNLRIKRGDEVRVAYTALHGVGMSCVRLLFYQLGIHLSIVPEQAKPDGDFPTTGKSNPEEDSTMTMVLDLALKVTADAAMATDGDADRFRAAFPQKDGTMRLLSGNQMGLLFADYIMLSRIETDRMPAKPAIIRSIVTSPLVDRIAADYGVEVVECLTGHKWICAVMEEFSRSKSHDFIFGYEESCSFTVEGAIRDKDGISAAGLCAEMILYWKTLEKTPLERLDELYQKYGFMDDRAVSKEFAGPEGAAAMAALMAELRAKPPAVVAGKKVVAVRDRERDGTGMPRSNVLQFFLEGGSNFAGRPSGTEPKIKFYINSVAESAAEAARISDGVVEFINGVLSSGV
jgi:phosphoglucomutase